MTTAYQIESPRESQLIVILDDDVLVTEALAEGLERDGRTVVTCNDLESAQLIVERLRPVAAVSAAFSLRCHILPVMGHPPLS